jgi:hypothetical protein
MNVDVPSDMIGLDQASAELDRLIAADQKPAATAADPGAQAQPADPSANPEASRAAQPGKQDVQTPSNLPADTPADKSAAAKQQPTVTENKDKNQQQPPDKAQEPSRYAKSVERQNRSWKELNDQKAALAKEREELQAQRTAWEAQRAQTEQQQKEAEFKPEQYEAAADKWEREGKFDLADLARAKAKDLRSQPAQPRAAQPNPQQQEQAQAAQIEAQRKEWWAKAAIDFPAVAKQGSPEQAAMQQFLQSEPGALQSPKAMYYAARMVAAEAAAARVPTMETELGALRAKVKELEALTAPTPPGVPHGSPQGDIPFSQKSEQQQLGELERMAQEMGPLR